MDEEIIDIPLSQLTDWLVTRKLVPRQWQERLLAVREALNGALKQLPDVPEVTSMLSGRYLTYCDCEKIMQLLQNTEEGRSRNIFGQYTAQHMRTWAALLRSYEKDNLFVAEEARVLVNNTTYEIPALRKSIANLEKEMTGLVKKQQDCHRSIAQTEKQFAEACELQGVQGIDLQAEVAALQDKLPAHIQQIEELVQSDSFAETMRYYFTFIACTTSQKKLSVEGSGLQSVWPPQEGGATKFPALRQLVLGGLDLGAATEATPPSATGNGDIDWGDDDLGVNNDASVAAVDWGDATDAAEDRTSNLTDTTTAHPLEQKRFRSDVATELLELRSFFAQRLAEVRSQQGVAMMMLQRTPALQRYDEQQVEEFAGIVRQVESLISSPRFLQLVNIKQSAEYREKLVSSLQRFHVRKAKLQRLAEENDARQRDIATQLQQNRSQQQSLSMQTHELRQHVQRAISKLVNRPVHTVNDTGTVY